MQIKTAYEMKYLGDQGLTKKYRDIQSNTYLLAILGYSIIKPENVMTHQFNMPDLINFDISIQNMRSSILQQL
ncbi:hypothetical protein pb186bvf_002624 [Paramecium bursaria]